MTIDADTVDNEYSFITAGHDLDLAADSLTNIGYKNIKRTTETGTDVKYWKYKKHRKWHRHCHYVYGEDRSPYYLHTRELIDGGADSVISAGFRSGFLEVRSLIWGTLTDGSIPAGFWAVGV